MDNCIYFCMNLAKHSFSHIVFIRFHLSAPVSLMNYSRDAEFIYTSHIRTISVEVGRGNIGAITLLLICLAFAMKRAVPVLREYRLDGW